MDLLREKCDLLGYDVHPYNALLNEFEEGMTVSRLDPLFEDVKVRLGDLITKVLVKQGPKTAHLIQFFDISTQVKLVEKLWIY